MSSLHSHTSGRGALGGLLLAALCALAPRPAHGQAQPAPAPTATAEAKQHFKAGSDAYRRADYATAIREFEAAYLAKPSGLLRYNVAQCYEKLGDIPSALRNYHLYLRETPNADDRATVEAAIANLEKRLQERGVQQLLVYSEPAAATVVVDGKPRGASPVSVELAPGVHDLSVALDGYAPTTRKVTITKEKSLEVVVALQKPDLTPHVAADKPGATAPAPAGGLTQTEKPEPHRVYTWVAAGVAAAAIAGGVVLGISAKNNANTLRDNASHAGVTGLRELNQNATNAAKNQATAANVCYGVGAVAGAAAVTLFFVEGSF
jgi:tetratricopeptide (TPR) repeat protein